VPVPEWGRILLGGIGCFLLAWISLVGGAALWLADALLIFLVLGRSGNALAGHLVAGAAGIVAGYLLLTRLTGTFVAPVALLAVGSILHVVLARFLLLRFAPAAARLESAGALAHLLLWSALLTPIAGALVITGGALTYDTYDGSFPVAEIFISWWVMSAVGTAVLLPFILSLAYSARTDLDLLLSRRWEALLVLALVALLAALSHQMSVALVLLLGLPVVWWSALRLDFRSTSLLCVMLALVPMASSALGWWPVFDGDVVRDNATARQEQQAYLLAIIVPALFTSLFAQEQRAGDRARQAALQALHAVMDAVPAAIVTLTPTGKVGLWSRGAERIFGWRRGEVAGRDPPYLAPDNAAQAASLRQRVLAGNEIQNQPIQRRNQAGEARELVINAAPQRDADGAITGIIAVMDDVTDRRRLEASREEHRARLAAILDAVAEPIITIDEAGAITSFSRAAEAVFGYAAAEVTGRNLKVLMPEPDRGRHDAYLRRYRETGVKHLIGTSRHVAAQRKDGGIFPAEITIGEAWLDGRRIFAGIVRDLSAKPAIAAPLPDAQPADPGAAKFLSKITHDLRQPLHALSLMTGALERRVKDPDARELVDHLSQIVRSTQATFENIVEWTRLEGGSIAAVPVAIPAGEILASLAQEFAPEAARRDLALRCVVPGSVIAGDPALLRRILRHLLDNAIKFTSSGKVLIGARRSGSRLRLIVADTGIGIPADQQDFIFVAYNQLDAGREAGGLGLGLAIARRLAALADIKVGIRSVPGKGSQFWIDVPLSGV
jgi:PAS domain S-box-containing protein